MRKIVFFFAVLIFFSSCEKDEFSEGSIIISEPDDTTFLENFGATTSANFIGQISDVDGNRITGVTINIGTLSTVTDHNGVFVLNGVTVYEKFAHIKASKEGYISGSRSLVPVNQGVNYLTITLLEKNIIETVN